MNHTPTPWQVIPDYSQENVYRLWDLDGNFHDDTSPETMDANACFIVRACNAHEELVAALKAMVSTWDCYLSNQTGYPAYKKAKKILATIEKGA